MLGENYALPTYRVDTRQSPPDVFVDLGSTDWSRVTWRDVGRPYRVERWAAEKREWEAEHGATMPVKESWIRFNRHFHELFTTDTVAAMSTTRAELVRAATHLDLHGVKETTRELLQLAI